MKDSHRRPPGFFERQYICRNTKVYYNNFNVTSQYNHHISREVLSTALRNLILKHHYFALNFYRLDGYKPEDDPQENGFNYEVRVVKQILFDDVVSYEEINHELDDDCFVKMNQLIAPMDRETTPLWRIIVWESTASKTQYISFYCDHALFDGTAAVQFHRDLIQELAQLSKQGTAELVPTLFDYEADKELLPEQISDAVENRFDIFHRPLLNRIKLWLANAVAKISQATKTLLRPLAASIFPALFKQASGAESQLFSHKPGQANLIHKYRIVNFTPNELTKILKFCKSEQITLTPFILSVGTRSLEKYIFPHIASLQGNDGGNFKTVSKISINGRRYYPDANNSSTFDPQLRYGVCVATTSIPLDSLASFDNERLLKEIKVVSKRVSKIATAKEIFWTMGDYLKTANFWNYFANQVGNTKRETLYTSNIGRADIRAGEDWEVKNIWFTQCNGLVYHFVFSVISSPSGGLNIGFSYLPEYDEFPGAIDTFVRNFKEEILDYTS